MTTQGLKNAQSGPSERPKGRQGAPNASKMSPTNHQKSTSGPGMRRGGAQGTPEPPKITIFHKNPMENLSFFSWIYIVKKALIRSSHCCVERSEERSVDFSCCIHPRNVKHLSQRGGLGLGPIELFPHLVGVFLTYLDLPNSHIMQNPKNYRKS